MRGSSFAEERDVAERMATQVVAPFGYGLHHVEQLLLTDGEPISEAWEQSWRRDQQWASRRKEVLARYGSLEAALAWQPREHLVRQAVAHLCKFETERPEWVSEVAPV